MKNLLLLLAATPLLATGLLDSTSKPVLDQARVLTEAQNTQLTNKAQKIMDETGLVIRLVIVDDVTPYASASKYAEDLYHSWRLGDPTKKNGLLLLIARKIGSNGQPEASNDMKDYCRIMTGFGTRKILPDDVVINELKHGQMMPQLPNDPFAALDATLDKTFEKVNAWKAANTESNLATPETSYFWWWVIGFTVLGILIYAYIKSQEDEDPYSGSGGSGSGGGSSYRSTRSSTRSSYTSSGRSSGCTSGCSSTVIIPVVAPSCSSRSSSSAPASSCSSSSSSSCSSSSGSSCGGGGGCGGGGCSS